MTTELTPAEKLAVNNFTARIKNLGEMAPILSNAEAYALAAALEKLTYPQRLATATAKVKQILKAVGAQDLDQEVFSLTGEFEGSVDAVSHAVDKGEYFEGYAGRYPYEDERGITYTTGAFSTVILWIQKARKEETLYKAADKINEIIRELHKH